MVLAHELYRRRRRRRLAGGPSRPDENQHVVDLVLNLPIRQRGLECFAGLTRYIEKKSSLLAPMNGFTPLGFRSESGSQASSTVSQARFAQVLLSEGHPKQQRFQGLPPPKQHQRLTGAPLTEKQIGIGSADVEVIGTELQTVLEPMFRLGIAPESNGHLAEFGVAPRALVIGHPL